MGGAWREKNGILRREAHMCALHRLRFNLQGFFLLICLLGFRDDWI